MTAYYNENDPFAAQWLRNLIADGQIAPGEVDERSIADVSASDLAGFTQHHFFAGIGGWSYALRLAGWPDSRVVWTGSCPCQPFSSAGKGKGVDDARHLWPVWFKLIHQCRPPIIFGEQVAAKAGRAWWFDIVSPDLEKLGMAAACADLCAPGVGAPHIRQRLFWLADGASGRQRIERRADRSGGQRHVDRRHAVGALGDAERDGTGSNAGNGTQPQIAAVGRNGGLARNGITARDASAPSALDDSEKSGIGAQRTVPAAPGWHDGVESYGASIDGNRRLQPTTETRPLADPAIGVGQNGHVQRSGEHRQFAPDGGTRAVGMADAANSDGRGGIGGTQEGIRPDGSGRRGFTGGRVAGVAQGDASGPGLEIERARDAGQHQAVERASPADFWRDAIYIECSDGKARPTQPGIFPLVNGVSGRVVVERPGTPTETRQVSRTGALRGAGNAIVPELAAEFIGAFLDIDISVKAD